MPMTLLRGIVGLFLLGASCHCASTTAPPVPATLVTYPAPTGLTPSSQYQVSISQLGVAQGSFVYTVNNIGLAQNNWQGHAWNNSTELTTSWTSFDFSDPDATFSTPGTAPITVQVSMKIPSPAWSTPAVRILPSASKIVPSAVTQVGDSYQVSFQVNFATQYSVEFYDAAAKPDFSTWVPENPLLIFANPIEADTPDPVAKNVRVVTPADAIPVSGEWGTQDGVPVDTLYFSPGVYDLSNVASSVNPGIYVLHSNQSVFIAGGAYVKGAFVSCPTPAQCSDAKNISIRGRGILSGENFNRPYNGASAESLPDDLPALVQLQGSAFSAGGFEGQQQARIEGLTFVQAPFDTIYLSGINNWVNNVKLISWYPSSDGIKAGNDYKIDGVEYPGNGVVENSFLKDGDDSIHLYSSGLRVNNVVIWQSKNASPFQFSSGLPGSIDDVRVVNSNVIHTEWVAPNTPNAIFDANLGGTGAKGHHLGYTFDEIHVENSAWQLARISIGPSQWQFGNTQLGTLSNLTFRNIFVTDKQVLPNIFQSYDRVHRISNVRFDNVVVAGEVQAQPTITFDANRFMSLSGDIVTEPMWANTSGNVAPNVQVWYMAQGMPTTSPITSIATLDQLFLNKPQVQLQRRGDFFGDGYASPLILDTSEQTFGIWSEPLNPTSTAGRMGYFIAGTIPTGYALVGVGDFSGGGLSDVLLWNTLQQTGLICTLQGTSLVPISELRPVNSHSQWNVAGIGDIDHNGVSDVLLRDASGNLEILYLGAKGLLGATDLTPSQLTYTATSLFKSNNPGLPFIGKFDSSWSVAGIGAINGYAAIIWTNAEGELGLTQFLYPSEKPSGYVIAALPLNTTIKGTGDYNGDGSVDLMLRNSISGDISFWYMGYLGGNYYQPAPATAVTIPAAWQN